MNKAELLQDLNERISASAVSGFWTDDMKIAWLDAGGQRVCDFYRWPFLELALTKTTEESREYYDYPSGAVRFKPNSIYQIDIEGETYAPGVQGRRRVNWETYQEKKQEGDDELVFTNHNGFYFLGPVPENGKTMSLYGLKAWRKLSGLTNDDLPITPEEMDEAVVRLALAAALRKAKKYDQARAESIEILDQEVGVLAQFRKAIEAEAPQGYGGSAQSSRWNRG
jgi:hypothetical protein